MAKHHWDVLIVTKDNPLETEMSRAEGMTQRAKCLLPKHENLCFGPQHACESWYSNTYLESQY